jgi:hypothetical protein
MSFISLDITADIFTISVTVHFLSTNAAENRENKTLVVMYSVLVMY